MTKSINYKGSKVLFNIEGDGPPIIFLHGWPTNLRLWDDQVEELRKKFKVITLDWLGFGKSDKPASHRYTFTANKEILGLVIKASIKEEETIRIVAHDIGGPAAILWSCENFNKLDKLILLNTVLYPFSTKLDKMSHTLFKVPLLNDFIMSNFWLKNVLDSLTQTKGTNLKERIQSIIGWHSNYTKKLKLKTILEPVGEGKKNELQDMEKKLLQISDKLHMVIAKEDPLCYEHMKEAIRRNPGLKHSEIEDCGHFISIDRPAELNDLLWRELRKGEEMQKGIR